MGPDGKKKLLLLGSNGMLAQKIFSSAPQEYELVCVDLPEFDITDQRQVISLVGNLQPDVIINCAAYTNVDGCETEQDLANKVNGTAVRFLTESAKKVDATLVHVSTDYVFDGQKREAYVEDDLTNPQSAYGASKLLGEKSILSSGLEKYFIIRTSWLYGPGGNNFVETIVRLASEREELRIVHDQVGSPTYTGDLADAIFALLAISADPQSLYSRPYGIYHFADDGQCSWYEFTQEIVEVAREARLLLKVKKILPIKTEEYPLPAARPAFSVFNKQKYIQVTGNKIPEWQESLKRYFAERVKSDVKRRSQ